MICAWHKIWTLSGRLSLMCNVQSMKKKIYIFRVYHIRIIAKKIGSHDMKQTDSSIIIVRKFWVKKIFPWKFNLEYGSTFTKLFMHVSSRNMFPITRNLQIRVHVYRPRHYCGDWLTAYVMYISCCIFDNDFGEYRLLLYLWEKFEEYDLFT
jgi:hypothetical protein